MKYIAIIGFGVVGGGITEVISQNKEALKKYIGDEVEVKKILDLRDFPDSPYRDRIVHDVEEIINDNDISVVCETMGGVNPAFDFTVAAMKSGKSVVTSNKELVAKRGVEILEVARDCGVQYLYEASVGGGIPEIRGMRTSLAGDTVSQIDGIVNGTTNYILSSMKNDGAEFDAVLREAQRLGYAEKDPTADVDGYDAQRKIMILTAVATNVMAAEENVYRETMTKVSLLDMEGAKRMGGTVKLIATSRISEGKASLFVCPFVVPFENPLSFVDGVYNAIKVTSPVTSDVMFYGRGAGRMPTAGAVVSDVASILSGLAEKEKISAWKKADENFVVPFEENEFSYYVRVKAEEDEIESARLVFGDIEVIPGSPEGYAEFIIPGIKEKTARELMAKYGKTESAIRILN